MMASDPIFIFKVRICITNMCVGRTYHTDPRHVGNISEDEINAIVIKPKKGRVRALVCDRTVIHMFRGLRPTRWRVL